jgi:hypothetical protein
LPFAPFSRSHPPHSGPPPCDHPGVLYTGTRRVAAVDCSRVGPKRPGPATGIPDSPCSAAAPVRSYGGSIMLPIPTADQIRGLSAPDLVICLSHYAAAEAEPCHYRNRLWLEWRISGLGCQGIANRWRSLPQATRRRIVFARYDGVVSTAVIATATQRIRKQCHLDEPAGAGGGKSAAEAKHIRTRRKLFSVSGGEKSAAETQSAGSG